MILVTVGTQIPFNRLLSAVSAWAERQAGIEIIAQIGKDGHQKNNISCREFYSATELTELVCRADVIVAHAGMGTILSALEKGKTIIIFPRLASLGEHRNDHQLATARYFSDHPCVNVALSAEELYELLDGIKPMKLGSPIPSFAPESFTNEVRGIIFS